MTEKRLQLHQILTTITDNVYFQSSENLKMLYPCILYSRDYAKSQFADNVPYAHTKRYMVTVIDRNPDSSIPDKISKLPMCVFTRHYVFDNLHHDIYTLYY